MGPPPPSPLDASPLKLLAALYMLLEVEALQVKVVPCYHDPDPVDFLGSHIKGSWERLPGHALLLIVASEEAVA